MNKLKQFFSGRYGTDQLSIINIILYCILFVLYTATGRWQWAVLSFMLAIIYVFRIFSKNISARYRENQVFLRLFAPVIKWFKLSKAKIRDRKAYVFFKCSACKNVLRIPKGKGKVTVTCPVCGKTQEKFT